MNDVYLANAAITSYSLSGAANAQVALHCSDRTSDANKMASSRFLQLPPELQTAIIDCLFRPEHLAQVCLVSKQLQRIALPLLYRDFSINVSEWPDGQLERFVAKGHSGHRHIRSLDIDSEDIEGEEQALKVAKDVLQVLPRNSLRSFR